MRAKYRNKRLRLLTKEILRLEINEIKIVIWMRTRQQTKEKKN